MNKVTRAAFRFFLENAGYCTPPGRAACALSLAKAEETAEARGWACDWAWDDDGDLGDHEYWCKKDCRKEHQVEFCLLRDENGLVIGSLSGIIDARDEALTAGERNR
jgi:hypothetical protein